MRSELLGYVAVSVGMVLAASCYAMLGSLFGAIEIGWIVLAVHRSGRGALFTTTKGATP